MEKLARAVDRFCYKHNNWGIAGLMRYIVIANVFVFLMDMFSSFSSWLAFVPYLIFEEGQIWRLLTFVAVPEHGFDGAWSILWFTISSMCYFFIGTNLEYRWGTPRFTMFYGMGILLNLIGGLILSPFYYYSITATMYYVNLSLFFSIATLYPNMEFRLYFIIPVKAKWLGWIFGGLFAYDIVMRLMAGAFILALVPMLAIFNYFLFFWDDISAFLFKGKHRAKQQFRPQHKPIDLQQAQKKIQQQKGYLHKCTICGVTDADNPDMDFRYCSKCEGYYCYCMDHINDHQHKI